jgi:DNA polymerase I-like protein with 3'-5' exonuclease and polymerase domains
MDFMFDEPSWQVPSDLPDLRHCPALALDTETRDGGLELGMGPGWAYGNGYIAGVSVAARREPGQIWGEYFPIRHPETDCLDRERVRRWLLDHMATDQPKVFFNGPYDLGWLQSDLDIPPPPVVHDTMCQVYMLDENRGRGRYNLDAVARDYVGAGKSEDNLRAVAAQYGFRKGEVKANLWRIPARYVAEYAIDDAIRTLELHERLLPQIRNQGVEPAYQLEMDLVPMVLEMRRRGIRVDLDQADVTQRQLYSARDDMLRRLTDVVGWQRTVTMGDVLSNAWLAQVHDDAGIAYPHTNHPTNPKPSFESDWMRDHDHELPRLVAQIKRTHETAKKFLGNFIQDFAHRGRIHPNINQYMSDDGGTRSYRFSYSAPALQQMPSRDADMKQAVRGVFLPEPGELWFAPDYSQQEYRLIVHFAYLTNQLRAEEAVAKYREDDEADFHQMVSDMTGLERKPAKDTNFAKAFGAGIPKFALMTNKTLEEARAIMSQYDDEMPFVRGLGEYCQRVADQRGWVKLLDGARSRFDLWEPRDWDLRGDGEGKFGRPLAIKAAHSRLRAMGKPHERLSRAFTHKAMNRLIQGSAARQTKLAMRACWREGHIPLLQMHDELDFSMGDPVVGQRIGQIMREVVQLEVPMRVDEEYGTCWGDASMTWDQAYAKMKGAEL